MKTRIITSIIALAIFVAVLIAPPVVFTIALAGVIFLMLYECYSATKVDAATMIVGFISAAAIISVLYFDFKTYISFFPVLMFIILMYMFLIIIKHGKKNYKDILANGFLTLYITFSAGCIWLLKEKYNTSAMLLVFICAWSTDTFAYFSGKFFGKHKLIPNVSPNKTIEGSVGGVIGSIIMCTAYLAVVRMIIGGMSLSEMCIYGFIIGLFGGIFSQLGDLTASAIKRDTNVKDFGWIFPGHGGFMDRFDSVIFIAPIIFGLIFLIPIILFIL